MQKTGADNVEVSYETPDAEVLASIEAQCFDALLAWDAGQFAVETVNRPVFIAKVEGEIAGFVLGGYDGDNGYVLSLDVVPKFRGKGVGNKLMLALEGFYLSKGAPSIRLEVSERNPAAIHLYEKIGYRVTGIDESYYGPDENALVMTKSFSREF